MSTKLQGRPWLCIRCLRAIRKSIDCATNGPRTISRAQKRFRSEVAASERQAIPLSGYYAELLQHPSNRKAPAEREAHDIPPTTQSPKSQKDEVLARARVVFGSRLAGPAERAAELRKSSTMIAGVLVPPKPEEPDNCCMSGCVNCVWDTYRDELEDWAAKSAEARANLAAQRQSGAPSKIAMTSKNTPQHVATSMDDDGGGSETNWTSALGTGEHEADLFKGIPVGIREFMRTEKLLKDRNKRT